MPAFSKHILVRSSAKIAFFSAIGVSGCSFDGDVSPGNNGKGAAAASGASTGGSDAAGGSDEAGGSETAGGSRATGGSGATSGGSGPSRGGASSAGAGPSEGGALPGGSGPSSGGAGGSSGGDAGASSGGGGDGGGVSGSGPGGAGGGSGNTTYLGCTYVGGYDRVVVSKRDAENNRCISLVLWGSNSSPPADVLLPQGWYVEAVGVGPAEECPSRVATRVMATVNGTVSFLETVPRDAGHPTLVTSDVTLTFPPGQGLPASERLSAESVDVRPTCNAACLPPRDPDCNDNPMLSSIHGRCTPAGTCVCSGNYEMNPATGRCL